MPRIYDSASDPHDFCRRHMPGEAAAWKRFGMLGHGPDDRGNCYTYEADHPDYEDDPESHYRCEKCRKRLTAADN